MSTGPAQRGAGPVCSEHTGPAVLVGAQLGPLGATAAVVLAPTGATAPALVLHVERATGDDALELVLAGALATAGAVTAATSPTPPAPPAPPPSPPTSPTSVVLDVGPLLQHLLEHAPQRLDRVAVVRVAPRPASDPVLARHPSDLVEALVGVRAVVPGGHDVLGRELRLLDREELQRTLALLVAAAPRSAAVVAAGSAGQPEHEREVADAVQAALPAVRLSLAHDFGGHGGAAREATVVVDAALRTTVDTLVERAQAALAGSDPSAVRPVLRLARSDGGSLSAVRARSAPALVVGGSPALQVLGAAHLAGLDSCRVLLPVLGPADGPAGGSVDRSDDGLTDGPGPGRSGHLVGGVRNGLVLVRPMQVGEPQAELVVPAAALQVARTGQPASSPVAGQVPDVVPDRPLDELACVGAALARPLAWLDEIAEISSAEDLEVLRRGAVRRATAVATANGADPGSADVMEVSTVAVPYSRAGTVRVRVRVGGSGRS